MLKQTHQVLLDDVNYAVNEYGSPTQKTLLLIHGLGWTKELWRLIIEGLADKYHLIIPDLSGHGSSSSINNFSFDKLCNHLLDMMAEFNINHFDVIGSSLGACLAIKIASLSSVKVDHLYLVDGGYYSIQDIPNIIWNDFVGEDMPESSFHDIQSYLDFMKSSDSLWNSEIERAVRDQVTFNDDHSVTLKLSSVDKTNYLNEMWAFDPKMYVGKIQSKVHTIVALGEQEPKEMQAFKIHQAKSFH